ncbi:MAG: ABC transporter ATP-binding protein [Thermomicrobiales bacterium]
MVLLGPSGCGKTTLLRMIGGLEHPTKWRHPDRRSGGERLAAARAVDRDGFSELRPLPALECLQQHRFSASRGKNAERRAEKANRMGGQHSRNRQLAEAQAASAFGWPARQRVALGAIVRHPNVFLLDEPARISMPSGASARDELQQFQRRIGTTTIYVTHDQVEAMGMGDRIAVIDQGSIRQIGTPEQIYDEPADTFVATSSAHRR